jgi:hypothetical protein
MKSRLKPPKSTLEYLGEVRALAQKTYAKTSEDYLKALDADERELSEAAENAAENLAGFKPRDFVDETICWNHMVADFVEENRERRKK